MIWRPAFKPHHAIRVIGERGVLLLSERERVLLSGRLTALVAPLLDGRRTADEIADSLQGEASAAEVYYALMALERKGYIAEATNGIPARELAFWSAQGMDARGALDRIETAAVSLQAMGEVEVAPVAAALDAAGARVDDGGTFTLVLVDDYLRDELASLNERMLRERRPWLLAKPVGTEVWLGPLFHPGETACWACLAPRIRGNREVQMFAAHASGGEPLVVPQGANPSSLGLAAHLIAGEVARAIAGGTPGLADRIVTFDVLALESRAHSVVKRPQCPSCGAADLTSLSPAGQLVELENRPATHVDGGYHTVDPEATLARYGHLVSPITGWVSRLERSAPTNGGATHVYLGGHNFARYPARDTDALRTSLRSQSAGKGVSDAQAKASGLCEALERASGVFEGTEPRRRARIAELGGSALHPRDLLLFSERQYRGRDRLNASPSHFNSVPERFDEAREIEWTPAWSLTRGEVRYLPTAYCYYGYPLPDDHQFCRGCSNGNAAGNTLDEAILQGFFELVERDAVALWWYNRVRRPALDMAGLADPFLARHAEYLRSKGREMWLLDLTSDLGIPVVAAVSRRLSGPEEILFGFGAHVDPKIAALRAITELNQMLAWSRDPGSEESRTELLSDSETLRWLATATLENQPYLAPLAGAPRRLADYERRPSRDIRDELLRCKSEVERRGMEMIVLDQTRPDIGLPVAKVVVPGLRHFWSRLAPGRLYDVPVALGWLDAPLPEEALNPIPMFL